MRHYTKAAYDAALIAYNEAVSTAAHKHQLATDARKLAIGGAVDEVGGRWVQVNTSSCQPGAGEHIRLTPR